MGNTTTVPSNSETNAEEADASSSGNQDDLKRRHITSSDGQKKRPKREIASSNNEKPKEAFVLDISSSSSKEEDGVNPLVTSLPSLGSNGKKRDRPKNRRETLKVKSSAQKGSSRPSTSSRDSRRRRGVDQGGNGWAQSFRASRSSAGQPSLGTSSSAGAKSLSRNSHGALLADKTPVIRRTLPAAMTAPVIDADAERISLVGEVPFSLGFVRVDNPREFSTDVPLGRTPFTLIPLAILGRTDSTSPFLGSKLSNRVELGIDNDTVGVSRRHLRVTAVGADYVMLRLFSSAKPTIRVFHFEPNRAARKQEDGTTKTPFVRNPHKDSSKPFRMNIGDVIQFDTYTRKDGSDPRHKFRLVRTDGGDRISV